MSEVTARAGGRAKNSGFLKGMVFLLGVADAAGTFMIYAWGLPPADKGDVRVPCICVILAMFAGTAVHELGHAIAALVCGWRIVMFTVRPFAWRIPSPSLAVVGKRSFPPFAGFVSAVPGSAKALTARRWAAFIAGGPVASLVFALGLGAAALVFDHAGAHAMFRAAICAGFGVHSAGVCLRALVPRGFNSDGARLRQAFGATEELAESRVVVWLLALLKVKIRPRDLPAWMIEALRAEPGGARLADSLVITRILDKKSPDFSAARRRLDAYRARHGAGGWLCACDAYVAAMYEGDLKQVERALREGKGRDVVPELTAAARAAGCARLRDREASRRYLAEMDAIVRRGSPFRDDFMADARRNVEALLRMPAPGPARPSP